jgi:hypothetical protein
MLGHQRLNRWKIFDKALIRVQGLFERAVTLGTTVQSMFLILVDASRLLACYSWMPFPPARGFSPFPVRRF